MGAAGSFLAAWLSRTSCWQTLSFEDQWPWAALAAVTACWSWASLAIVGWASLVSQVTAGLAAPAAGTPSATDPAANTPSTAHRPTAPSRVPRTERGYSGGTPPDRSHRLTVPSETVDGGGDGGPVRLRSPERPAGFRDSGDRGAGDRDQRPDRGQRPEGLGVGDAHLHATVALR